MLSQTTTAATFMTDLSEMRTQNTKLHIAAGLGDYAECVHLAEDCCADIQAENEAGLRPVDLALNILEQLFRSQRDVGDYEKIVTYLGSVEMKKTGRERYLFIRDDYDISLLLLEAA